MKKADFIIPDCATCTSGMDSLIRDLDPKTVDRINAVKGCNYYQKGQLLFSQGNRPVGLFCVYQGNAKIYKLGVNGKDQIFRLAGPGDIIGYRSIVSDESYKASAEALDDTCVCFIPRAIISDLLLSDHQFVMALMRRLSRDLEESEAILTNMAQMRLRNRLANSILLLKDKFGMEKDNATLKVKLTREDLASLVGTVTESVIRLLHDLQEDGVIRLYKRTIKIVDQFKLEHIAYSY